MEEKQFGERIVLKVIRPSEIEKMREDEVIAVNRIFANKRLMEIKLSADPDMQAIEILNDALKEARGHERKRTGSVPNVKMTVGDIKKVFNPIKKMPYNSLKLIGKY